MVVEERHTEREDWRASSTAGHSVGVWQPPHTWGRQDKTWEWVDTQGEREGRRQGVALPKTLTTQKKRKRQKDNEHLKTIKSIA